jgi:hypothetical protein
VRNVELNIKRILLPHLGILAGLCVLMQVVIAIRGSRIDLMAFFLLAGVAIYYFSFQYTTRAALRQVRFGELVAHAAGLVIVNLSFHLHAGLLLVTGERDLLDESWAGLLFGMFAFWGIGFLVHLVASVAMRGYESLDF